MMCSARSLARHARRQLAVAADAHAPGLLLAQRLRGQRVGALRRADAEGQRAEAAVGAGVAVAADHGEAGQHEPELGPHHVHDALARLAQIEQPHAGRRAPPRSADHSSPPSGKVVPSRPGRLETAWSGVAKTSSGSCTVRPRAASSAKAGGRRQVVEQMAVDVQQHPAVAQLAHHVRVPELVEQGAAGHSRSPFDGVRGGGAGAEAGPQGVPLLGAEAAERGRRWPSPPVPAPCVPSARPAPHRRPATAAAISSPGRMPAL